MKNYSWMTILSGFFLFGLLVACESPIHETPLPQPTSTVKPSPGPTLTPVAEGMIVVDASQERQVVKDLGGGNFIHKYSGREEVLDPVGMMNVSTLNTRYARVWMGLKDWEPINDNNDAGTIDWAMFKEKGITNSTFQLMQDFQSRDMEIIASIWEVPDWMVYEPSVDRSRWIPPDRYPETVESITAWLLYARNEFGVEVDYISFNEPILGVSTALTSQEQREMISQAGARFEALGLKTKWLLGDCAGFGNCLNYAKLIYDDPEIKPYLGPMAVHSWDILDLKPSVLEKIADFVDAEGLDLWVTEGGWDPFLYTRPEEFPSWNNALRLSAAYNRIIQLSRATVVMYWEFLGDDYSTNDGARPYPALEMLHLLTQAFPTGTVILETGVNTPQLYAVAGKTSDGYILHIVHTCDAVQRIEVQGLPEGIYAHHVSTAEEIGQDAGELTIPVDGFLLELLPKSIHLLTEQPR